MQIKNIGTKLAYFDGEIQQLVAVIARYGYGECIAEGTQSSKYHKP